MSAPSVNKNITKQKKVANTYAQKSLKSIRRRIKIRSSSVMSVNINILKEIHKNHKEETDINLKTEEM